MSDVQGAGAAQDNGSSANVIYILYLVALLLGGLTTLVGVIMAYVYRGSAPAWVQTHYQFQIRTFWIVLLGCVIGGGLSEANAPVWERIVALAGGKGARIAVLPTASDDPEGSASNTVAI